MNSSMSLGRALLKSVILGAFIVGGIALHRKMNEPKGGPPAFSERISLKAALDKSAQSGTPVFAFVTADWCGPCQHYKATALADQSITQRLQNQFIPVLIDVDRDRAGLQLLAERGYTGRSIPASVVLLNGVVIDSRQGAMDSGSLHGWLHYFTSRS